MEEHHALPGAQSPSGDELAHSGTLSGSSGGLGVGEGSTQLTLKGSDILLGEKTSLVK